MRKALRKLAGWKHCAYVIDSLGKLRARLVALPLSLTLPLSSFKLTRSTDDGPGSFVIRMTIYTTNELFKLQRGLLRYHSRMSNVS